MGSNSGRKGIKRPLCEVSESSTASTVDNEANSESKLCGACRNPLESPPPPKIVTQASLSSKLGHIPLHKTFVTCANFSKNSCYSIRHNSSPHFHLGCSGIPTKSKLFLDLMQDLKRRDQMSTNQESSPALISTLPLIDEINSGFLVDKEVKQSASMSIDKTDRRETSTKISTADCNDTIDPESSSPNINVTLSGECNEKDIQPFRLNDESYQFLCPFCDVEGTSQYLQEYFSNFRMQKMKYYTNEESRDFPPVSLCQTKPGQIANNETNGNKQDSCLMDHLIRQQQKLGFSCAKTELQWDHIDTIVKCIDRCEKDVQTKVSNETECDNVNEEFSIQHQQKVQTEYHHGQMSSDCAKSINTDVKDPTKKRGNGDSSSFDAMFLVGKPVKLFCNINNAYHVGRIIDWRKCDELNDRAHPKDASKTNEELKIMHDKCIVGQNLVLDPEICRTQFLVRFRAGFEGRKVTVHEWIFLEEHPLMVGLAIVWAKSDKVKNNEPKETFTPHSCNEAICDNKCGRQINVPKYKSKYRPAQIFVRSALEIISTPSINLYDNEEKDAVPIIKAMTVFFGKKFRFKMLPLSQRESASPEGCFPYDEKDELTCSFEKVVVADFEAPPARLEAHLRKLQCDDAGLVVTTALASMEVEEQRRILRWHTFKESNLTVS